MWIGLIKNPALMRDTYQGVPEMPVESDESADIYQTIINPIMNVEDDWPMLESDFVTPIDDYLGLDLDIGSNAFFDVAKCEKMVTWLKKRLEGDVPSRMLDFYEKLLEYCERAVKLGTGVVVEL